MMAQRSKYWGWILEETGPATDLQEVSRAIMPHLLFATRVAQLANHCTTQDQQDRAAFRLRHNVPQLLEGYARPRGQRGWGGTGPSVGENMALLRRGLTGAADTSVPVPTTPKPPL